VHAVTLLALHAKAQFVEGLAEWRSLLLVELVSLIDFVEEAHAAGEQG
jgi:hypothetical protein